jgi:hypothetical protein
VTPRLIMSAGAAVLAIGGLALLFTPGEILPLLSGSGPAAVAPLVLQLWGAALLGLAAVNWTGRGLTLGGIYGRALVLGNTMHWTVGGLTLLRAVLDHPGSAALWVAAVLYGGFAVAFAWLLTRDPLPAA